ncbi:hypothetical protein FISHEDRAFT_73340 [Fistulina hepatica ATCC 64428]|uniref:DUF6532 domain-containing protein n=1 Tax=Fistulina hepatica ATCC 64428 TaxID=1128425 RepID=A0A0D7ADH9_9AGAR|nr:hypothetical protein FISHEDRAFT_73340 [Fistulina hepatica ATCC 64428]
MQSSSGCKRVLTAKASAAAAAARTVKKASVSKAAVAKAEKQRKAEAKKAEEERLENICKRAAEALANESDEEDTAAAVEEPSLSVLSRKKRRHLSPIRSERSDSEEVQNDEEVQSKEKVIDRSHHGLIKDTSDSNTEERELEDADDDETTELVDKPTFFNHSMNIDELPTSPVEVRRRQRMSKLTKNHFTPVTLALAEKAKRTQRQRICTEDGFPTDKDTFTHKSLRLAAHSGITTDILKEKLQKIEADVERQSMILTYVNYATGSVRGDLKNKAKGMISGHYKIPGDHSKEEIQEIISWLLSKKRPYIYRDVDVINCTYDKEKPYMNHIFFEVIQTQFCTGNGRVDRDMLQLMVSKKEVPCNLIALVATAIEAALSEWITGERHQIEFSDDSFAPRYDLHCKRLDDLMEKAPTYSTYLRQSLLSWALMHANKAHLLSLEDNDSDDDMDYEALEASAQTHLAPMGGNK